MEKFEILWELPKPDTETQSLKNGADGLAQRWVVTNLPFVKNAASAKHNKEDTPVFFLKIR